MVDFTQGTRETREAEWLIEQYLAMPIRKVRITPSEWARKKRYLPRHVAKVSGYYRFALTPFLREVVDCLGVDSPFTLIDFMKGVQVGATVGVLENIIGYYIDHVKDAPMLMVTTDADLAKIRVEKYIIPMLDYSELAHLIQSNTIGVKRSGVKEGSLEWVGGGFLLTFGANSPGKLRSTSIQILLLDEVDSYIQRAGRDGKPHQLAEDRTATFGDSKKILRLSTPLIAQMSVINSGYMSGDQRKYMVPCKGCGEHQALRWRGVTKDGVAYGMHWKTTDEGALVPGSVRYLCKYCSYEHKHSDVMWWYRDEGKHCYWKPHAEADHPTHRSYHLPAFYSVLETWEEQVLKYLEAYDPVTERVKDIDSYQRFYNNVLGSAFTIDGERLDARTVQFHRRQYHHKTVPNKLALAETGSCVHCLILSVDVQKTHLDVLVQGFCDGRISYGIEHRIIEGDCTSLDNEPWQELDEMISKGRYLSDDGKEYPVALSLIDASWSADLAYNFALEYEHSVFPIMGRKYAQKNALIKEFQPFESKLGTIGYNIVVDIYKDRCANALRRERPDHGRLRNNHISFPNEFTDEFFNQLCKEYKREVINPQTGQRVGTQWYRPGGGNSPNEAWDLLVYCTAGFDMVVTDVCMRILGLKVVDWSQAYEEMGTGTFWWGVSNDGRTD